MPALSRSRRSAAGIALIVAGALFVLAVITGYVAATVSPWLYVLAELAVAAGFVILAIGSVANLVARIALFAGALGWLLVALGTASAQIPPPVVAFGAILAAIGGVVGAIVLYTGKEITDRSAVVFIIATLVSVLFLLGRMGTLPLGEFGVIVTVVLGVALAITGFLFYRVQRGR